MFPPLSTKKAHLYCTQVIKKIEDGSIQLLDIAKPSEERPAGQGVMIGVLVCREAVLLCLSGRRYWLAGDLSGFEYLEPIISEQELEKALKKNDKAIHELTEQIAICAEPDKKASLKKKRTELTDESLKNVFSLYTFYDFSGNKITLNQIIEKHGGVLPQTGTGDCCAPNLFSYAFKNHYHVQSLCEVYFGRDTETRKNGHEYPPCDERCRYILPYILGLEILYRDDDFAVINKQPGLLSVPGRGEDKQDCAESRFKQLFSACDVCCELEQPAVHRLDMETSGILILAFNKETHSYFNKEFREGRVSKKYIALLDGVLEKSDGLSSPKHGEQSGLIEIKARLDVDNRPHQIYDEENGKLGVTKWTKLCGQTYTNSDNKTKHVTRVLFEPETGRTHQLRIASAFKQGFNLPIIGDSLYGTKTPGQRLYLHASEITFIHPKSARKITFFCTPDF